MGLMFSFVVVVVVLWWRLSSGFDDLSFATTLPPALAPRSQSDDDSTKTSQKIESVMK